MALWEALGALWEGSGSLLGSKIEKVTSELVRWTPWGLSQGALFGGIFGLFFVFIFVMFSKRILDTVFFDLGSHKGPKSVPK